jgi:hypothetical protein
MKKKPIPRIPANNIQDFLQLAVLVASERQNPNEFLRTEANTARVTWAKKARAVDSADVEYDHQCK